MYDLNQTYEASNAAANAGILSFNMGYSFISLAYSVLVFVALWKLFEKAGVEGWKAIIPIYNMVVLFQLVGLNPWLLLLGLIPCLGWIAISVITIIAYVRFAKKFGQDSTLFTLLIIFFAPIALAILAFDNKYTFNKDA